MCRVLESFARESGNMLARWTPETGRSANIRMLGWRVSVSILNVLLPSRIPDEDSLAADRHVEFRVQQLFLTEPLDQNVNVDALTGIFSDVVQSNCEPGGDTP